MKNNKKKYSGTNWKKVAGKAKRLGAAGLTMGLLLGMGAQAKAASLKDIFDAKYYADTYGDLKAAYGYDREALWQHFVTFGLREGRNMNGFLDVVKYRQEYADLAAAFGDNWDAYLDHFLLFGAKEGRDSGTAFNALDYAARYGDLKAAYGEDVLALWRHYQTNGAAEGREARSENVVAAEKEAARKAAEEAGKQQEAAKPEVTPAPGEPSKPEVTPAPEEPSKPGENPGYSGYTKREDLNDGMYLINEYNFRNQLIKSTMYNSNDEMVSWNANKYDVRGNRIETTTYRPNGQKDIWQEFKYDADNQYVGGRQIYYAGDGSQTGRMEEQVAYSADKTRKLSKMTYYDENDNVTFEIESENDKKVKQTVYHYDEDGNVNGWDVEEYDETGNCIKFTTFDANENISHVAEYTYAADGQNQQTGKLVKEIFYSYDTEGKATGRCEYLYDADGSETIKYYDADGNEISSH